MTYAGHLSADIVLSNDVQYLFIILNFVQRIIRMSEAVITSAVKNSMRQISSRRRTRD